MTGIEILAEYTAGGFPAWAATLAIVVAVIGLILLLCGICADNEIAAAIGLVALLSFIVVGIAVEVVTEPEHTRYKVTISDDVKLVEFLEQYEILDTEGEIYTIREVIPDA
jgi:L-asparagine transporter-like permease